MLYVGTGENYSSPADDRSDALLAFRLRDGELVWHAQRTAGDAWNVACMVPDNPNCPIENGPDVDFGAGTMIASMRCKGTLLLAGQKSGDVYGIDPDRNGSRSSGATRWVAVASRAASTSAWPRTASDCSCRSPT
jgi:polyvinyl alcohol dehydrogenase (cytochrome)